MDDYREAIASCCKQLRLSTNLAENAMVQEGSTHQEYVYNLFKEEVQYRKTCRVSKYINTAGFPYETSFLAFNASEVQFPSDVTIETLKSLDFLSEGKNIVMYGGTGTGKTMLSICIGIAACSKCIPVKFFRTAALVNQLSEAHSRGTLSMFHKKLNKAEILILDEFGYVPYDRTGAQLLFDLLSEIHEKKVVILNTNLEFSRWVNVLYDEQMTAALIGRLMHHCHLILFPGENNRLRESSINDLFHSKGGGKKRAK
ncbi:IS21-like element helper ATPase IstB [Butyrivibrio fibrisolvens]|uniref:IS21-like element helper ATPase IstB n=1 Tax=Butyrivibrio fibrisolvens TaxID=831 RepID=UPI0004248AC3|nr:IS21-like element helper ATPase IstB [Butyrivibrio fibrisolvens]